MSELERMLSVIIIFNKERRERKRSEQNHTELYVCMYVLAIFRQTGSVQL